MSIKLPKQWRNWCADQRLKPHTKGKSQHRWFYLVGHGYHWRVNCYGYLQRGDSYDDFDRWALCDIEERPLPKTRAEFRLVVAILLENKND